MDRAPVNVTVPPLRLSGSYVPPEGGAGVVVFAHGSGSSRFSPRNSFVAEALQQDGLGTLLLDLLRPEEAQDRRNVFDIPMLAGRLVHATEWLASPAGMGQAVAVGYFGASTGAGAALLAAALHAGPVRAVVSRGGRPDLAGPDALSRVRAPTLLIVGSLDQEVLALNRTAAGQMRGEVEIEVIQGASHLFEEPGKLEEAVALARNWFASHIARERARP